MTRSHRRALQQPPDNDQAESAAVPRAAAAGRAAVPDEAVDQLLGDEAARGWNAHAERNADVIDDVTMATNQLDGEYMAMELEEDDAADQLINSLSRIGALIGDRLRQFRQQYDQ